MRTAKSSHNFRSISEKKKYIHLKYIKKCTEKFYEYHKNNMEDGTRSAQKYFLINIELFHSRRLFYRRNDVLIVHSFEIQIEKSIQNGE